MRYVGLLKTRTWATPSGTKDVDHTVDMADDARYPEWMVRFNRAMTSRTFTYVAAGLFVLDGLPRIVDGRVIRGLANLAIAAVLVARRQRTRQAALGESESARRRAEWFAGHPVAGALLLGAAWGGAMSVFFIVTKEGPIVPFLVIGVGSGLLFFGPAVVLLSRRYRTTRGG